MNYNFDFRFRRALNPQGLRIIETANHAILEAIQDCRNSGLDPEQCPAVKLLSRHLRRIVDGIDIDVIHPEDARLRFQCNAAINELRSKPLLPVLFQARAWLDPEGKRSFHTEAARALRDVARSMGIPRDGYDLRSNKAGPAVSGEITLHSDKAYIQISEPFVAGHEILYRSVASRTDYTGRRNHYAAIAEIHDPATLASKITKDLNLEPLYA